MARFNPKIPLKLPQLSTAASGLLFPAGWSYSLESSIDNYYNDDDNNGQ